MWQRTKLRVVRIVVDFVVGGLRGTLKTENRSADVIVTVLPSGQSALILTCCWESFSSVD